MANLTPVPARDDVYQIEQTDYVEGGAGGTANLPNQQLLNRTEDLYGKLDTLRGHAAQALRNVVLAGRCDTGTGEYTALSLPASSTLRLNASPSDPFIFTASTGYDELGEIAEITKITSNLDLAIFSGLANRTYLAVVRHVTGTAPELALVDEGFYYATAFSVAPPPSQLGLWYNTATGVTSFGGNGSGWSAERVVIVGRVYKSGGLITGVETFPYREPYYCEVRRAGAIETFAGNTKPLGGYLLCNGAEVLRVQYPKLFKAIGTVYGSGDGSTTFNIPDLRGQFVRGWDNGAGVDAGRTFGSLQGDAFESHKHNFTDYASVVRTQVITDTGGGGGNLDINILPGGGTAYASNSEMTFAGGANETRPTNVAMNFYIKF